ncbi:glutathionylspermidine synthase family protein [Inconstantimicrobium mannanitabidum]|uniref:Uncharacterized protein n=1 Tax=Inconstantimicrobium mannanitabidum TaxID=1604901 RepID=A0ACB5RFG7_9CLOT|nr:glutathionylspermidine synthase family protein [Clostridium sp. TW13]GKX67831.1 hypothetical protein rsdtw13_30890 [Clostridium sp. TW13]
MMRYESYWDKLLFDYKLIHSKSVKEIYSDIPYFMNKNVYKQFKYTAGIINNVALKIKQGISLEYKDYREYLGNFQYLDDILLLKRENIPVFWARYDGFIGQDSVFYAELNYDKPCAQRECMVAEEMLQGYKNINEDFTLKFKQGFYGIKEKYYADKPVNIAILVDPAHYEEAHLALLFQEKLKRQDLNFILAGADNFIVEKDEVRVFEKKIDIILRLFPTEFLYEISDFKEILRLFDEEKLLILNDPRDIIMQCKNLYSYLWKLIKNDDTRLSTLEKEIISKVLPYTEPLTDENINFAMLDKDRYVIKPVYGRYSEDVFIGVMHTEDEWIQSLEYIKSKMQEKNFLLQHFKEQEEDISYYYNGSYRIPAKCFGNFGIYLCNNEVIGACVRWNSTYLTSEGETWFTPIGIEDDSVECIKTGLELQSFLDKLVFEAQFTGFNIDEKEYLSLDIGTISEQAFSELKQATVALNKIFIKTRDYVIENLNIFKEILSIEGLEDTIKREKTKEFTFIGRLDWIMDSYGRWKLLEINSETPAGICEATYVEQILEEQYKEKLCNEESIGNMFDKDSNVSNTINVGEDNINYPKVTFNKTSRINDMLVKNIVKQGKKIINDYNIKNPIIGFVSLTYYEDWVTTNAIMRMFKEDDTCRDNSYIYGNINDLVVEDDGVYLYGTKLDFIFRYYPLDWLLDEEDENLKRLLNAINDKVITLNPASTIISQSKAFFVIIYELIKHGFYSEDEMKNIERYIPFTTFDYDELNTNEFVIKPLLGREGQAVQPSYLLRSIPDEDIIFQERIFQKNTGKEGGFMVFGVFITGEEFSGIYTRIGDEVTTKYCKFQVMRSRL